MADVERTVAIIFQGVDKTGTAISGVGRKIGSLADTVQNAAKPLADLGDAVLKVDAALAALAVGGLVYATKKSFEFETSVVNLEKILGSQADQIGVVSAAALELSDRYGESSTGILDSMTDFKRAGFEVQEIAILANDSMNLVLAASEAGFESAQATEIIIATLKGFKAPAEDAARLVDILNTVSNQYATNVTELGVGMATLSPIAKKMGFSFEETAGVLTPIIEIFRSGDEASTALKMGLLKLIDDAAPVRSALASIGVSQTDTNGALRSGKDILFDVAHAFETLDENQKLFVTSQLVGIRQAAKMVEVFDGLAYSSEITAVAMGATGSAALEVAKKLETGEVAVKRFVAGFNNLSIVIGDEFRAAATEAINSGADIENVLENMVTDGTFDPIFAKISAFASNLGATLGEIAKNLPAAMESVDWGGFLASFDDLDDEVQEAIESLFGDIDLKTPEGLTKVVQGVIDGITTLVNITAGMVDAWGPWLAMVGAAAKEFLDLDDSTQKATGNVFGFAQAIEKVMGVFSGFGAGLDMVGKALVVIAGTSVIKTILGIGGATGALQGSLALLRAGLGGGVIVAGLAAVSVGALALTVTLAEELAPMISESITFWDDLAASIFGYQSSSEAARAEQESFNITMEAASSEVDELNKTLGEMNSQMSDHAGTIEGVSTEIQAWMNLHPELKELNAKYKTEIDEESLKKTEEALDQVTKGKTVNVEMDTEKIKAQAEIATALIEGQVKTTTATLEAETKKWGSMFESVNVGIKSTGDTMQSLWETLVGGGDLGQLQKWELEKQIDAEEKRRQQEFDLQKELTKQQIEMNKIKMEQIAKGEAMITIDGSGLEPHLEMIMWEVLEQIKIRANATGAEFLLGV